MTHIVASEITERSTQVDGRVWVHEVHTDDSGASYTHDWLAQPTDNLDALLAEYANGLDAQFAAQVIG